MKLDGDDHLLAKGRVPMKWQSDTNNKKPSIRQTVLVAALVSLIIGALTTFTAFKVTSRQTPSPLAVLTAPLGDHPGIPKEYVEKVLAFFSQNDPPSNSTHSLEKRQEPVVVHHKCNSGDTFLQRRCDFTQGVNTWHDFCKTSDGKQYPVRATCPENGMCSEHLDGPGLWPVVVCRPLVPKSDQITTGNHKGGQYGFHRITGNHPLETIGVMIDMGAATISGYIVVQSKSRLLLPQKQLVAHVRGVQDEFCNNNSAMEAVCSPRGKWDLKNGNYIDYTFALQPDQEAFLFYSLWGSHG